MVPDSFLFLNLLSSVISFSSSRALDFIFMDRHFPGACPSFVSEADMNRGMGFEMSSPGAYSNTLYSQQNPHDQPIYVDQNPYGFPLNLSEQYPAMSSGYQSWYSHQRDQSTSIQSTPTHSTRSSGYRSSGGSGFSQWSYPSDNARDQHTDQTEHVLAPRFHFTSPPPPTTIEAPAASPSSKRVSQRQPMQDKEPFHTCVSRTKRSRRSQKEPRYWCTSCEEGFREKYDWKRHEETYQERNEKYECNLCKNVYFLDKDFVHHHQKSHRCKICVEQHLLHVDLARRKRQARTGWGCGFCNHFSSEWTERCNHISRHFEKGETMATWYHSQVIFSLLQRPEIIVAWCRLLESKQRTKFPFYWKPQTTGRVEGYPEANAQPQLQDLLEYYTPDQNAADIARLAFDKGRLEKALPPPPVPEKDHGPHLATEYPTHPSAHHAPPRPSILHGPMDDVPSWDFLGMIPEDSNLPTNVCDFAHIPHDFHTFS